MNGQRRLTGRSAMSARCAVLASTLRGLAASLVAMSLVAGGCERLTPRQDANSRLPAAGFINKVWTVTMSSTVAPGTLYVFLADGTLVITSPHGKPLLGAWRYENGALSMIEQSIAYKVDILGLSEGEFRIRSNNPGEPVEITLVPADGVASLQ